MKLDILSKQNLVSASGIVRKDGSVPKSKAELKKVTREIKAALKEAGLKPGNYYVNGNSDGTVTVDTRYTPKETVSEAEFKRNMKAALKEAGFKCGGVKGIRGPGRKFEMVVKASSVEESDLESDSATKRQLANAQILFGSKAAKALKAMEEINKEKLVNTGQISLILSALKTKDTVALEKFAKSAAGKSLIKATSALHLAKTPAKMFAAIKMFKAPKSLTKLDPSYGPSTPSTPKTPAKTTSKANLNKDGKELAGIVASIPGLSFSEEIGVGAYDFNRSKNQISTYDYYRKIASKLKKFAQPVKITESVGHRLLDALYQHSVDPGEYDFKAAPTATFKGDEGTIQFFIYKNTYLVGLMVNADFDESHIEPLYVEMVTLSDPKISKIL